MKIFCTLVALLVAALSFSKDFVTVTWKVGKIDKKVVRDIESKVLPNVVSIPKNGSATIKATVDFAISYDGGKNMCRISAQKGRIISRSCSVYVKGGDGDWKYVLGIVEGGGKTL